jgi:hypothetical protein
MDHLDGNKMIETKRRGISTFIATLLLMVLAVSAGVVIYAYTMGYLGSFGGPQTMGAISIDAWSLDTIAVAPNNAVNAYIRNIGKTAFEADKLYVNGVQIATAGWSLTSPILEAQVGTLTIKQSTLTTGIDGYKFVGSTTYDIKLIGKDNTQLSFQIKK